MDVQVHTRDLPGIGRQFEIACTSGSRIAVVVQNNGARHLYTFEPDADGASGALQLTEDQARALGAILAGVYFRPAEAGHDDPAIFGSVAIDWLTVATDVLDLTVADVVRPDHPSATFVAIVRGETTMMKPAPDMVVHRDDQLLVAGNRADIEEIRAKIH